MYMFKYVLKRIALMLLTFFIIMSICFVLFRMLEPEVSLDPIRAAAEIARRKALGYDKPILVQYGIYLKGILTKWDCGTSFKIQCMADVTTVITSRLAPTVLINVYSLIFSVPFGILLGIYAALKKNKWQDHVVSTLVMIFVSVPSYVYAFLVQYILAFKAGWFPLTTSSLADAGGSWLSPVMFHSMILPILSLSFGSIAGLTRFTRAELTEVLTSDFMLLARTKGLTKSQPVQHALTTQLGAYSALIIGEFLGVLGGALSLNRYLQSPVSADCISNQSQTRLQRCLWADSMFYTIIGLSFYILRRYKVTGSLTRIKNGGEITMIQKDLVIFPDKFKFAQTGRKITTQKLDTKPISYIKMPC